MGVYSSYVLPRIIDKVCAQANMAELRTNYVPRATGNVLEIGLGSGHNLEHYTESVIKVTAIDPAEEVTDLAQERIATAVPPVQLLNTSAEKIPFESDTFDTVVSTWTLCSIPDVTSVLAEIRRVIKPGGQFIFIEHGASPEEKIVRWQQRIEPAWKFCGGGCHLTRNAPQLIEAAGFRLPELEAGYFSGPRWVSYTYRGVARPV
jgi:ubiquinone/menaquinone biosynthesis C-methylase UbiE